MMISTEQQAIILQICLEQEQSLLRLIDNETQTIFDDLQEEGYEVNELDIAEEIAKQLLLWESVKRNPGQFTRILDEANISMIKHHLVQSYLKHPSSPPIWRHLNLYDEINSCPN